MVYWFIKDNYGIFGLRWLLRKFNLCPNAYYNFLKARRSRAQRSKQIACKEIESIYNETNGILGYRNMMIFLSRRGINLSKTTVHKYMNKELMMKSVVRRKKPGYVKGKPHKVFPNLIKQNFTAEKTNHLWCTDFTYLFLTNVSKRYNCSIIDLYDRSIVASITGKSITSQLAIDTMKKALKSQPKIKEDLIIHSNQGRNSHQKNLQPFVVNQISRKA